MRIPIVPRPDERSARTVRRSRVVSYVLAALAAVVLSIAPSVLGDPQQPPWHTLLHVVRPVVAGVLIAGAVAVQLVVGLRWHADLRRGVAADDDDAEDGTQDGADDDAHHDAQDPPQAASGGH